MYVISISQPYRRCLKDVCFIICRFFYQLLFSFCQVNNAQHDLVMIAKWKEIQVGCVIGKVLLINLLKGVHCLNWLSCKALNLQLWFARFLLFCLFFSRKYTAIDCLVSVLSVEVLFLFFLFFWRRCIIANHADPMYHSQILKILIMREITIVTAFFSFFLFYSYIFFSFFFFLFSFFLAFFFSFFSFANPDRHLPFYVQEERI